MLIISIINFIFAAFLGYIIGRWADNYLNIWIHDPIWVPHHWIYGLILMVIGFFYLKDSLGIWATCFGTGVLISDLQDFLDFKVFAKDGKTKETRKFWHIN